MSEWRVYATSSFAPANAEERREARSGINFRGGMLLGASMHPTLRAYALILSRRINLAYFFVAVDKGQSVRNRLGQL